MLATLVRRAADLEVYLVHCRCFPGFTLAVDRKGTQVLAYDEVHQLSAGALPKKQEAVTLEVEADAAGATLTVGEQTRPLPTKLEQVALGSRLVGTVQAPGRRPLAFDREVKGGPSRAAHWLVVLPPGPVRGPSK